MNAYDRLAKVYLLITAAQAMIHQNRSPMSSIQMLQDARIIASVDDGFLANNQQKIADSVALASKIIEDFQTELKGQNENNNTTSDSASN